MHPQPNALRCPSGLLAGAISAFLGAAPACAAGLKLHLPSPEGRDQVIYFVLTDRFADGDTANYDQGAGEFAAGERSRYNGGDLKGLRQRVD